MCSFQWGKLRGLGTYRCCLILIIKIIRIDAFDFISFCNSSLRLLSTFMSMQLALIKALLQTASRMQNAAWSQSLRPLASSARRLSLQISLVAPAWGRGWLSPIHLFQVHRRRTLQTMRPAAEKRLENIFFLTCSAFRRYRRLKAPVGEKLTNKFLLSTIIL